MEPKDLRRRAEAQIALGDLPSKNNLDPIRLLHELQVHKIELELQNEELISANRELDALRRRFQALYLHAPVGYLTMSREGLTLNGNDCALEMLKQKGESLIHRPFRELLAQQSHTEFDTLLTQADIRPGGHSTAKLLVLRPHHAAILVKAQCRRIDWGDDQASIHLLAIMDVSASTGNMDDGVIASS